jgi:hypothetical protein
MICGSPIEMPPSECYGMHDRHIQDWQSTCHPDVLKMLAYWESKCEGRNMPSRGDIDPGDLTALLPNITLVDVVDDDRRFVYRLVGTGEVQLRGWDPTGKSVIEGYFGASLEDVLGNYQFVCDSREPFYEEDQFQMADRDVSEANLFLPLSDDGRTVNKIMVFSINCALYRLRMREMPASPLSA